MSTPENELTKQLQGDLDQNTQDMSDLAKNNQPEPFNQPEPQRNMGVMATMPYLVGIAALGGKVAGLHAKTMLAGVNGMVGGVIKGNEAAYQDSKQKYDDSYKRWLDKFSQQQKIYTEMRQVYKGRIDADMKALEFARRVTGDERKDGHADFKDWMQEQDYARKLQETNGKIDYEKGRLEIQRENISRVKQQAATKAAEHSNAVDGTIGEIDDLIAQITQNPDVAGAQGYVTRGLETARTATGIGDQNDVHAHQFQTAMETLMAKLPKLLTGSSKSAKDERMRIDNIANALKLGSTGPIAIGKLNELKAILQNQRTVGGEGAPDEHGFVLGKEYTDGQGRKATYMGDGQWQAAPPPPQ